MKFTLAILFSFACATAVFSQQQFSVFFASDKFDLTPKEKVRLSDWMASNSNSKIVGIYGFTDEDGSNGYNDTLAKNRINYVYKLIKDKIKIRDDFKTRSFGELHNLSKVKAENRKVTLFYIEEKDLSNENKILGIKEELTIPKPRPVVNYPDRITFENPDGSKTDVKLDVDFMRKMSQSATGEKLKVENLNFQINTFIVVPASRGKLYELLLVMKGNPDMKIEIQGHLCCMPNDRLDLSTQRAKAVNNFLVTHGIDERRVTYKGFGSTQPIYPLPEKDEAQRAANRRVEIMIVAN